MTEFDRYAADYRCEVDQAAGVSVERMAGEKARLLLDLLAAELGDPKQLRVLDVGCGIGLVEQELARGVGQLCGADVSLKSLEFARSRAPTAHFVRYNGMNLPFGDASFDAVFASCVLHHVAPNVRPCFIAEMLRPLRQNGVVVIIEHNPANPVTRRIVSRCAFDADAVLLACRETIELLANGGAARAQRRYIGFLPFRHRLVERAEQVIGWLPAGAQYCVWSRKIAAA
jgi:ubiquinone/menaquinone biosynthesis C-methylase UbiE